MHESTAALPTICCRITDPPLELYTTEKAFRPNPTTVRFGRAIRVKPGDLVFDIGTGTGPLAIKAAMDGASHVYAVDPVPLHCDLARRNAAKYNLESRITVLQGRFFEPFDADPALRALRADVIIGDVSGIAEAVSYALGWYSDEVPTGGPDGTDQILAFLAAAPAHLKPTGSVYFPVAYDLSDSSRIMTAAKRLFGSVLDAFDRPHFEFPLTDEEVAAIQAAYHGSPPPFIQIQQGRRPYWRGQILVAANPR